MPFSLKTYLRVFCFLSLLLPFSSLSQNLDSLRATISADMHDTLKIQTYLELGKAFERNDLDSSLSYLDEALQISERHFSEFPQFKGFVLRAKAAAYLANGDEECFEYYLEAMAVFESLGWNEELTLTQYELAKAYDRASQFDNAIEQYEAVINRNIEDGTEVRMAASYNNTGLLYYYLRELEKASGILLDGIRYVKTTPDTVNLRAFYMNYGLVLKEQNRYELAKQYMQRALLINEAIGIKGQVALAYTNIGQLLIKQDSLDRAFESLTKGWEISKEINTSGWPTADYYRNVSTIEFYRGNYQQSHDYIEKSVANLPEGTAPQSKGDVYGSLVEKKLVLADSVFANNPAKQSQLWNEALPYAIEGWELAKQSEAGNVRYRLALGQANLYAKLKDYKKAFEFGKLALEISQDINDQAKTDAIARMSAEFETQRIEAQNNLLQETQKRQTAQLKQQRYLIAGALVVLLLIVAIMLIIQRNGLKLKKANAQVEKSLEQKELLLKEIHHRVKNNLQVVSSLLDLQSRGIEDEKALSTFMEGQNRVKAMALIHQKLYQNEDLATIDFAEYAEQLMTELASIYAGSAKVKGSVKSAQKANFDIDTAIPLGLILNELISNAYKYAFHEGDGELSISIEDLGNGKHQLTVSDSGLGLPQDFDFTKAKSLGLRLVRRLSKQLYGSAEYYYEQGSKFIITFTDTLERKSV
ncbi:two-component sensor histidine kinase [Roseivirga ehrenbergii]|uniref:Histidine kinase domain-containing protein n=2 Tax=Roseivirga ehrenbergii (strain DSM 102268 / JCM 13514 / KCTC 12282 / NCIMB 14502 / KMM 6017) TaxID=279360 RepID=A0A150WX99_ROSEK|nr:hypothetical protein MB14_11905 [Roseivirga ehrenbergii]TCK99065.1 two-component sensor histidine kinase [Roseivirga ehrenbergii]